MGDRRKRGGRGVPPRLRQEAEGWAAHHGSADTPPLSDDGLLHELRVHQIELEMQNEALREAQIALEVSRDRYVDLYEFAPVGYLTLRRDGSIAQANRTASELLAMERPQLTGRRFSTFVVDEERARWERLFVGAVQSEGDMRRAELTLKRGRKSHFHAQVGGAYAVGGEQEGPTLRLTLTDVSPMVESQQALERANQELASFSYAISHDLQGPLRSINGFGAVLLEEHTDRLDAEGRELLERILASTRRMGRLIDGLLALSRVTRAELVREWVDLSALAQTITSELARSDPAREAEFIIHEGITAYADASMMTALLQNLLDNAWKFTAPSPSTRIEFAAEPDGSFRLSDNGAGFDMADSRHLFEPFHQLHPGQGFTGVGIGLATVNRIVTRHGGRIWAESTPGQGATFRFTLPAA